MAQTETPSYNKRMGKAALRWITIAIASQVFWQIFWHYWGEHTLDALPSNIIRGIFIAVSGGLGAFFVFKIIGKLFINKNPISRRHLQYLVSSVIVVVFAIVSPFIVSQINEQDNTSNPTNKPQTPNISPPSPTGKTSQGYTGIQIDESSNVTITDVKIEGFDTGVGINNSQDVNLNNVDITLPK